MNRKAVAWIIAHDEQAKSAHFEGCHSRMYLAGIQGLCRTG